MNTNNQNELIKKNYEEYLLSAKRLSPKTKDNKLKSIFRFDNFFKNQDYKLFNKQIAKDFQRYLNQLNYRENPIAAKTKYSVLKDVQEFILWLSDKAGYKSKIEKEDILFLNPSHEITQIARNPKPRLFPVDLNYVKKLVLGIKGDSELDLRDKAIISMLISTGIRIEALSTLSIGSIDMVNMVLDQDPVKGVKTKYRKRITTCILPLDSLFIEAIKEWYAFLIKRNLNSKHPLFPKAEISQEQETFSFINNTISDKCMKSPNQISEILKKRAQEAGQKYYSPHTLRHLHVYITIKACKNNIEAIKAVSQHLGHSKIDMTFLYAYIPEHEVIKILHSLDFRGLV